MLRLNGLPKRTDGLVALGFLAVSAPALAAEYAPDSVFVIDVVS